LPLLKRKKEVALSPEGKAFIKEIDALAEEVWDDKSDIVHALADPPDETRAKRAVRVSNAFFSSALALLLLLVSMFLATGFPGGLFGLRFFAEPTNAMAPAIRRGALLVTVNRRPEQINPGDLITYNALPGDPESRLTRIVYERLGDDGNYRFVTRLAGEDAPPDSMVVHHLNILGVGVVTLPYAAYVVSFLQLYAIGIAVLAGAFCLAAVLLRKWLRPIGYKRRQRRKEREDVQSLLQL